MLNVVAKSDLEAERAMANKKAADAELARIASERAARDEEEREAKVSAHQRECANVSKFNEAQKMEWRGKLQTATHEAVQRWSEDNFKVMAVTEADFYANRMEYVAAGVPPLASDLHSLESYVANTGVAPILIVMVPSLMPLQANSNWQRGTHVMPPLNKVRFS
jgi:hypothetical protein